MGYHAHGYGLMVLKGESKIDDIADAIANFDYDFDVASADGKRFYIDYNHRYDGNYYEEDVRAVLDEIKDFVEEGSRLELAGEDDEHWAFTLLSGHWEEENAKVIYPSDIERVRRLFASLVDLKQGEDEILKEVLKQI